GRLEADGQRITQALVQLADNAVQHTPPGTTIGIGSALSAHDDGTAQARLWVRDEGPGIALGEQQRIFERFARGGDGPRR
ncbi:two-component sensor histidine kinase, partial [Enterococcus hirae]